MIKRTLSLALLSALVLTACKEKPKQETIEVQETEVATAVEDDFVTTTYVNEENKELEVVYNNTQGTATFVFEGETVELEQKQSASGVWFKNDSFELRGKGNDIELLKDGEVVFSHQDDVVTTTLEDKVGQTLDRDVDDAAGTAIADLDGGEVSDLVAEKVAYVFWYKNDQYVLRGNGEKLELKKDGEVIYKNYYLLSPNKVLRLVHSGN